MLRKLMGRYPWKLPATNPSREGTLTDVAKSGNDHKIATKWALHKNSKIEKRRGGGGGGTHPKNSGTNSKIKQREVVGGTHSQKNGYQLKNSKIYIKKDVGGGGYPPQKKTVPTQKIKNHKTQEKWGGYPPSKERVPTQNQKYKTKHKGSGGGTHPRKRVPTQKFKNQAKKRKWGGYPPQTNRYELNNSILKIPPPPPKKKKKNGSEGGVPTPKTTKRYQLAQKK